MIHVDLYDECRINVQLSLLNHTHITHHHRHILLKNVRKPHSSSHVSKLLNVAADKSQMHTTRITKQCHNIPHTRYVGMSSGNWVECLLLITITNNTICYNTLKSYLATDHTCGDL